MKNDIKHIHMIGICGAGMGSLAGLLTEGGYTVTGSDKTAYPPMSTQIEKMGVQIRLGFKPENLEPKPDLVVIGNVISKGNPEAEAAIERKIPCLSMPEAIKKFFLADKFSIVVTGTHGKTTTSNIIAWLLEYLKEKPGFLTGGAGLGFGKSYRVSEKKYFVIEGDEYDTAYFDKGPKFLHYKPDAAIINAIEFDHADIYKDLEQIKTSFRKLIEIVPKDGLIVACADYEDILELLPRARCRSVTFGFNNSSDYRLSHCGKLEEFSTFLLTNKNEEGEEYLSPLAGRHNILNAAASIVLLKELGFSEKKLKEGLKLFTGVKRRHEIKGVVNGVTVIDDFAHHPTAIRGSIEAIHHKYSKSRLWAIFEPRSNTTRRNVFQKELARSFLSANKVVIAEPYNIDGIPRNERLDVAKVVEETNAAGCGNCAHYIPKTENIVEFITRNVLPGDVLLVMSNGDFDGICEKLISSLQKRKFSL